MSFVFTLCADDTSKPFHQHFFFEPVSLRKHLEIIAKTTPYGTSQVNSLTCHFKYTNYVFLTSSLADL